MPPVRPSRVTPRARDGGSHAWVSQRSRHGIQYTAPRRPALELDRRDIQGATTRPADLKRARPDVPPEIELIEDALTDLRNAIVHAGDVIRPVLARAGADGPVMTRSLTEAALILAGLPVVMVELRSRLNLARHLLDGSPPSSGIADRRAEGG